MPLYFSWQLAAALAAQQGSLFGGMTGLLGQRQPRQNPALPRSSPSTSSGFSRQTPQTPVRSGFITSDQLAAALAAASPLFNSPAQQQPSRQAAAPPAAVPSSLDSSLATMREMGIVDEGLARRALLVMGGDLQAAIDLIFSGWLGEDDSAN